MTDPTGGSAFPHLSDHCQRVDQDEMEPGLTIRDWFAGMALQGMLASDRNALEHLAKRYTDNLADVSYGWADSMIKARNKQP